MKGGDKQAEYRIKGRDRWRTTKKNQQRDQGHSKSSVYMKADIKISHCYLDLHLGTPYPPKPC